MYFTLFQNDKPHFKFIEMHYSLLKASHEVYKNMNLMLESFFAFTEHNSKLLQLRIKTWILAEFWLKKAIKDTAEFLKRVRNDYLSHFLSDLTEDIEQNLSFWLTHEKGQLKRYGDAKTSYKLTILTRINAGKVLLAYTRMKKHFPPFSFGSDEEYFKEKAQILAETYKEELGLKSKDFQKDMSEKIKEKFKELKKENPSTSGN
ncbi:unnamed protein product [Meloidogyne enterolobii]|uniref:Uncharacterized protein n=2 Tax=Meloidogyne enterolobii TaxID=390850 RepID=A0ACB0ZH73_MELEN